MVKGNVLRYRVNKGRANLRHKVFGNYAGHLRGQHISAMQHATGIRRAIGRQVAGTRARRGPFIVTLAGPLLYPLGYRGYRYGRKNCLYDEIESKKSPAGGLPGTVKERLRTLALCRIIYFGFFLCLG